jgi:hypothetical protein
VIRILRLLEIVHVTPGAIARRACKLIVYVTLRASCGDVRAGQCELGLRVVIELDARPLDRGVAERAVLREARRRMVRAGRLVEIGQMAGEALAGRARKFVVDVTLAAVRGDVRTGQRKTA